MIEILNWIGGEAVPAKSLKWLDAYEPATGQVYSQLPDSDEHDVELAVQAARRAQPAWAALPAEARARVLRTLAELIRAQIAELAKAESRDNGKPVSLAARLDIPRAAANFDFFADAITQFASESHATPGFVNYTLRAPIGVVATISPWNLPLYLLTWKIAPALAAGNAVVAKPSEVTPMTAHLLGALSREAGLPPGVLNIVHGLGDKVGAAISKHPGIQAISFTGSTRTGAEISRVASPLFKKLSLEMGGKNATIVFADSDRARAVDQVARAAFLNQGQICLCGSRIYVERSIYAEFRDALVARARALKVGDPAETSPGSAVDQGALVSREQYEKVLSMIATARLEGGKVLCGGVPARVSGRCEKGWFIEPTLLEGLPTECRTNQEEIFGPVATITPFDTEDEVLGLANGTRYGLAASVWTENASRAHRVAGRLEAGVVWINCWMERDLRTPFGGVKESGVGREGGWDALRFFTESKNVCVRVEGGS